MIDTVRDYLEVSQIKKIIEGMSYDKSNTLHWHITDSQSFPFVSNCEPLMAVYGAYSPRHVYKASRYSGARSTCSNSRCKNHTRIGRYAFLFIEF